MPSETPPDLVNGSVDYSGADSYNDISKNAWRYVIGSTDSGSYVTLASICGDRVIRNGVRVHSVGSTSFIGFTSTDNDNLGVGANQNLEFSCPGARTTEIYVKAATRISFQGF